MSKTLLTRPGISEQGTTRWGGRANSFKEISEYLSDAVELAKNSDTLSDTLKAFADAAPWAKYAVGALGEVIPPVKFAAKLFADFTKETDPEALGHLACTLAYQRAIEQTVKSMEVPIVSNRETKDIKKRLAALEPSADVDFGTFSCANALAHNFVVSADRVLRAYTDAVGYTNKQALDLVRGVHRRFVPYLKKLLSHGSSKDRFEPFSTLIRFGTSEQRTYETLEEHAQYQRWLFEKAPVLKGVPYALGNVYVSRECGNLYWREIKRKRLNPSSEAGGRNPIVDSVMELIADPTFNDAIVIRGAAGAGKSALTLKLCSELLDQGLSPIRIRMTDLQLNKAKAVSERVTNAIQLSDDDYAPNRPRYASGDLFSDGSILGDPIQFHNAVICPYVLIFDGWDEISLAADEGFKVSVRELLRDIRSEFLKRRRGSIRLILTGRHSIDVDESKFFRDETRVLTILPFESADLETLIANVGQALKGRHIDVDHLSVFKSKTWQQLNQAASGNLTVFGLPLLAHLEIRRLLSPGHGDHDEPITNPTALHRSQVDMTIQKSGKAQDDPAHTEEQPQLSGDILRDLLWQTASAITNLGEENISFAELKPRIRLDKSLIAAGCSKEDVLSSLMISFYFKGRQTEQGAEFENKSFREYLFAEAIVEELKTYGRTTESASSKRERFWKEFGVEDPRFSLAHTLSELLAPQWLRPEVVAHLEQLLTWEIGRVDEEESPKDPVTPTLALSADEWARVRDGIADVWDWWAEGVHLRPQPAEKENVYKPAYVHQLIESCNPQAVEEWPQSQNRAVTMDAHLGDGLVRLCSLIHYLLAVEEGWLRDPVDADRWAADLWDGVSTIGNGPRRCQSSVTQGDRSWVFFAPTQEDPHFFANYAHRINAAGWRPLGPFPLGVNLSGIDLRAAIISIPFLHDANDAVTVWTYANLSNVKAAGSCLHMHDFAEVLAKGADFRASYLVGTDFLRANLELADFTGSRCVYAIFEEAKLRDAFLRRTDLENTSFANADLEKTDFKEANVYTSTSFEGSNFEEAKNLRELLQRLETQAKD